MSADHDYMARALELARRGLYTTTPNPRVGCVLVRDGEIVGEGFHERAGEPHAEVHALRAAGPRAERATAYVTLEPCAHHGRTPPCANALIEAKVARVVAAIEDPNPQVAGRGLDLLRQAGIAVESGVMAREASALNAGFISRMTRGRPWIRIKVAASFDGKTALNNGVSQWITGAEARLDGHRWRARACAVLTGIGTVKDDDPQLNVRGVETPRQPVRVVVDSRLDISPKARVIAPGTIVAAAIDDVARAAALRDRGVEVIVIPNAQRKVDLAALFQALGSRGMNEIHVEAGWKLNGSLVRESLADELLIYMAPRVIGDRAHGMFDLPELTDLGGSHALEFGEVTPVGADLRILAKVMH